MKQPPKTFVTIAEDIRSRIAQKHRNDERLRLASLFAKYSDKDMRRLWDEYDGFSTPDGFCGEDIHSEMNRRDDGEYCAV